MEALNPDPLTVEAGHHTPPKMDAGNPTPPNNETAKHFSSTVYAGNHFLLSVGVDNHSKPLVVAENSSPPNMETESSSPPNMETESSSPPNVEAENSSPDTETENNSPLNMETENNSPPNVKTENNSPPNVETENDSPPNVVAENNSSPRQVADNNSLANVEAENSSPPNAEEENNSLPNAEEENNSPPIVETENNFPPNVVAENNSFSSEEADNNSLTNVETENNSRPNVKAENSSPPNAEEEYNSSPNVEVENNSPPNVEVENNSPPNAEEEKNSPTNADEENNFPTKVEAEKSFPPNVEVENNSPILVADHKFPSTVEEGDQTSFIVETKNQSQSSAKTVKYISPTIEASNHPSTSVEVIDNSPTTEEAGNHIPPTVEDSKKSTNTDDEAEINEPSIDRKKADQSESQSVKLLSERTLKQTTDTKSEQSSRTASTEDVAETMPVLLQSATECEDADQTDSKSLCQRLSLEELDKGYKDLGLQRCPHCKLTTDDTQLFKNHSVTCSGFKRTLDSNQVSFSYSGSRFRCDTCCFAWTNKGEFQEHLVCHITDSPYICLICKQCFDSRSVIEKHINSCHAAGEARCGLKGIRKGRQYVEDLIVKKKLIVTGKVNIPKTPQTVVASAAGKVNIPKIQPMVVASAAASNSTPASGTAINTTASTSATTVKPPPFSYYAAHDVVSGDIKNMSSIVHQRPPEVKLLPASNPYSAFQLTPSTVAKTAPYVRSINSTFSTAATNLSTLCSTGNTLKGKEENLSSMFGVMNPKTKEIEPTYVSKKIHTMFNTTSSQNVPLKPKPDIQYSVRHITEYTCVQQHSAPVPTVQSVAPIRAPQQPLFLVFPQTATGTHFGGISVSNPVVSSAPPIILLQSPTSATKVKPAINQNKPHLISLITNTALSTSAYTSAPVVVPDPQANIIKSVFTVSSTNRPTGRATNDNTIQQITLPVSMPNPRPDIIKSSTVPRSNPSESDILKVGYKKMLFKLKAGQGFVCEPCKKFTKEEFTFRKHLWVHFHGVSKACGTCTPEMISGHMILKCKLINDIVCNLIKTSLVNVNSGSDLPKKAVTQEGEVIEIIDDEPDEAAANINDNPTEIIVLDDDNDDEDHSGNLRIAETYSVAEANKDELALKPVKENKTSQQAKSVDTVVNESSEETAGCDEVENLGDSSATTQLDDKLEKPSERGEIIEVQQSESKEENKADDKHVNKDLLNKSLTNSSEAETELAVSEVIDSSFKTYDPGQNSDDLVKLLEEAIVPAQDTEAMKESTKPALASKTNGNAQKIKDFDENLISTQGHNAFYVCGYEKCGFVTLSSNLYRSHLKAKEHEHEYNYICGHCGYKDYVEDAHVRHMFSHTSSKLFLLYECPLRLCKFKTNLIHFYAQHLQLHNSSELTIKCTYCNKTFPTIESLSNHLKQNLLKFVSCPYCSFKFVDKQVISEHIKLCHPDKMRMIIVTGQVVCCEREINFYVVPKSKKVTAQGENSHKAVSEPSNIDIPALLDKVQNSDNSDEPEKMDTHEQESGNEDVSDEISLPEADQPPAKEKPKNIESVASKAVQDVEKSSPNALKSIHDSVGPKCLLCRYPGCEYLSYNQMRHSQHLSIHKIDPERNKRFLCNRCPRGQESLERLKQHLANHIGKHDINVYCCVQCPFQSNMKSHINDHCKEVHSPASMYTLKVETVECKAFTCKFCNFKSRISDQVLQHENLVHKVKTGELSTSADPEEQQVDANTSTSSVLQKSNPESTKKQKYHCHYCEPVSYFKRKVNLKEHILNGHGDIDNKQFISYKCKHCMFTATMKELIIVHINRDHKEMPVRVLRKMEYVDQQVSSENGKPSAARTPSEVTKQLADANLTKGVTENNNKIFIEIVIPDGNIFKDPFVCPKCHFTSNLRINAMKHLKEHPELKPVRPAQKTSKKTARKSSTLVVNIAGGMTPSKKHVSALHQEIPGSIPLVNPFTKVKEAAAEHDLELSSPSKDYYILGESSLHSALSACFIPVEQDLRFKCRICQQKIAKKFVLHKHILDHLNIVFFKCKYCNEGAIERTLLVGHIQNEHSSEPLTYTSVSREELEKQFKDRIFSQNFSDNLDMAASAALSTKPTDHGLKTKQVHELSKNPDSHHEVPAATKEKKTVNRQKKCPLCRYTNKSQAVLDNHIAAHKDPLKRFMCNVCDYRANRCNVVKHIYGVYHANVAKAVEVDATKESNQSGQTFVLNSLGQQTPIESFTVSKSGVYEIKTMYKCKICGSKKETRSTMYSHFKSSPKCSGPYYQCSMCSFKSSTKVAIRKHGQIRHPKGRAKFHKLPIKGKMKILKIPIRQDNPVANLLKKQMKIESQSLSDDEEDDDDDISDKEAEAFQQLGMHSGVIECRLCRAYTSPNLMKLQYHMNTAHQGDSLHCIKCSYKTPLIKHMFNHCKNVHMQDIALYSSKNADQAAELKSPKNNSTPSASSSSPSAPCVKCPKCEGTFSRVHSIKSHLFKHFKYFPHTCHHCRQAFCRMDHLRRHISVRHPDKEFTSKYIRNEEIEQKVSKFIQSLRIKLNVLVQNAKKGKQEIAKHVCSVCDSSFDTARSLKTHARIHQKTDRKRALDTDSDSEAPPRKQAFKPQGGAGHTEDKDFKYKVIKDKVHGKLFQCSKCDKKRSTLKFCYQHFLRVHCTHRYKCYYCEYSQAKSNIYRHIGVRHRGMELKAYDTLNKTVVMKGVSSHQSASEAPSPARSLASPSPECSTSGSVDLSAMKTPTNRAKVRGVVHDKAKGTTDNQGDMALTGETDDSHGYVTAAESPADSGKFPLDDDIISNTTEALRQQETITRMKKCDRGSGLVTDAINNSVTSEKASNEIEMQDSQGFSVEDLDIDRVLGDIDGTLEYARSATSHSPESQSSQESEMGECRT